MSRGPVSTLVLAESIALVAMLVAVAVPFFLSSQGTIGFAINAMLISLLGIAWNLTGGFGGLMSFGHAVLFGSGAYASAMLQIHLGLNAWLAAAFGILAGGLVGAFVGALSFRYGLRGSYFALVTLAFAEVFRVLASSFQVTGGGTGLSVDLKPGIANLQFADRLSSYGFVVILVAIALLVSLAVRRSRFGAWLIAVRENEEAAKAVGVDVFRIKVAAMALSGLIAGGAGVAYLQIYLFVDAPIGFGPTMSIDALLGPMIGGAGTLMGPVLGTVVLHVIGEVAKDFIGDAPGLNLVLYGVVLLLILRFMPNGLMGVLSALLRRARGGGG
ncbi:MAG: branched-chain amino acid ABC transporter permease [Lautropia sp.]